MNRVYNPLVLSDSLFNKFFDMSDGSASISNFVPAVNTREGDYAYHIEVDLPGIKKDEMTIELKDDSLVISGERKFKNELKQDNYYKLESTYGKFQRTFSLPKDVDFENIKAEYSEGVLEICIPKMHKSADTKKISIK